MKKKLVITGYWTQCPMCQKLTPCTLQETGSKPCEAHELLAEEQSLVKALILDIKKEWVKNRIYEYFYQKEVIKPTHVGKEKAMESMAIHQKHQHTLENTIAIYKNYLEEHYAK